MDYDEPDTLEEQVNTFRGSIREIEDILARVREADPHFISGLCKFISTYRKMQHLLMLLIQLLHTLFITLDGQIVSENEYD